MLWRNIIHVTAGLAGMIRRNVTDYLLQALTDTPVVLVNGARQTGKSTLVESPELTERSRQYLKRSEERRVGKEC